MTEELKGETPPNMCPVCLATHGFILERVDIIYEAWVPLTPSQSDRIATEKYTEWSCSACDKVVICCSHPLLPEPRYPLLPPIWWLNRTAIAQ